MADTNVTEKSQQEETSRRDTTSTGAAAQQIAARNRHPILALRDEFDRLFDEASSMFRFPWSRRSPFDLEPLLRTELESAAFAPPAEVEERADEYRVTMEMPGMDEQAVDLSVQDDVLSIKAEKSEEKDETGANRYVSERRYGLCARSFRLPANVDRDRIAASMKNGVLTVVLPKTEPGQPSKRKIEIAKA
ncbi:Hsp20/alpha crystallin family protein [Azospirillum himalayense]|uniref:Hsp20/alpha crystallin family protein n=1 Tax=Azospirillum himalayense TaxID=654847 RepID=A0ABW0GGT4_9PROT